MTYVLGLNAYHADAAACLVKDGDLVAAVEEERFRRIKHWGGFPSESIRYCLAEAGISLADVEPRRGQQRQSRQPLAQARLCADLGRRPGLRAGAPAPSRRSRRRRRQPQAAPAGAGVPRHRARRRASSLPSRLGLPGVAVRQGRGGVGRRLRRFLLGRLGPGRGRHARRRRPRLLPAFARRVLRGDDAVHRLSALRRRVQGDGPRALRRADATSTR